ncbi:MAG TPA: TIGR03560 family F420-dependent LLM class oxidoreductase [Actinomycetota bacterium]|jgi:F420-dependent oxidoreductase-like protein|nr:TIGR03560 family F420-dependent LLM class oxidoreductase [Actinomycetota bacterium]
MRLGLKVNQHQLSWPELSSRVRLAEASGFDGAWIFDHFKAMDGDPGGPCMEAWTLLAALAASTERIRLGAMVTGITYRHPSVLAAEAVTVDHVSSGRLELALGAAWAEDEHRELGLDFPGDRERTERLEEGAQLIRLLMTQDDVSFEGRHYRLDHATYRPRPVQQPHPPIWIGAGGERVMIPIAARLADVWHCFEPFETLPRKVRVFEEHAGEAGRDPSSIRRAVSMPINEPWSEVTERAEAIRNLGFDYLVIEWPEEGHKRLEGFVQQVMPDLTG